MTIDQYRLDICAFSNDLLGVKPHAGQELFLYTIFPPGVEPKDWPYRPQLKELLSLPGAATATA